MGAVTILRRPAIHPPSHLATRLMPAEKQARAIKSNDGDRTSRALALIRVQTVSEVAA